MPLSYDLTAFQILGQIFVKFFVGILLQTMTPKGHFEINWPLKMLQLTWPHWPEQNLVYSCSTALEKKQFQSCQRLKGGFHLLVFPFVYQLLEHYNVPNFCCNDELSSMMSWVQRWIVLNDELSSTMSWVGCLLTDSELFILFAENSQILLKISVIPIILTFMYLVALNLFANNQLNSSSNSTHRQTQLIIAAEIIHTTDN